ncbi:MAG: iron-sulfur cluster assembly scaffold protein [Acidobacteriota bacterium]|nr:iron-sulfur cluster assembly scaffold protein [Blastocatellia bacterium]MDW8239549.1 iron-sulfur cluster assembly scaffold protein [Acidobacteriota bacterium]
MYTGKLAELIQYPRHVGEVAEPSGVADVTNPVCGDRLRLSVLVVDHVIKEAKFKAYGCAPTIAAGSVAAEMLIGRSVEQALRISRDEINQALGGLPASKLHCATLAVDAIEAAMRDVERRKAIS